MCGRFSQFSDLETLFGRFAADGAGVVRQPMYNIAPGMNAAVVVEEEAVRRIDEMRWGLVPPWAKDPAIGYRLINARAETVFQKPSFREAVKHRRCVIPADGFFEWSGEKKLRVPWFVHAASREPLFFAGLWERWQPPGGGSAWRTFTILTTTAACGLEAIHDRMPVILDAAELEPWLAQGIFSPPRFAGLLNRCSELHLVRYRVSTLVNAAGNNAAGCVAPVPEII